MAHNDRMASAEHQDELANAHNRQAKPTEQTMAQGQDIYVDVNQAAREALEPRLKVCCDMHNKVRSAIPSLDDGEVVLTDAHAR